jgi:hypothetical protein
MGQEQDVGRQPTRSLLTNFVSFQLLFKPANSKYFLYYIYPVLGFDLSFNLQGDVSELVGFIVISYDVYEKLHSCYGISQQGWNEHDLKRQEQGKKGKYKRGMHGENGINSPPFLR